MVANEKQIGGNHYKNDMGLEHWDIVAMFKLDYFQGQITKYVMRYRRKNGVEDLQKALHYLEKYIELLNSEEDSKYVPPVIPATDNGAPQACPGCGAYRGHHATCPTIGAPQACPGCGAYRGHHAMCPTIGGDQRYATDGELLPTAPGPPAQRGA